MRVVALAALVACGSPKSPEPEPECTLDYGGLPLVPVTQLSVVQTADMNGDGHVDLVVASPLRVLLGDGTGGFRDLGPASDFQVAVVVVADFNEDGFLDAYTIDVSHGNRMLFGTGTGDFGSTLAITDGFLIDERLRVADLDGDGHQDLVGVRNDEIAMSWGRGDGSLTNPAGFKFVAGFSNLAVADIDGDGRPDIVVREATGVRVYTNQGSRAFASGALIPTGIASGRTSLAIDDLDGDGRPEVVTSDSITTVVLPNLDGALGAPVATLDRGGSIQIADMDGDHRRDIVVSLGLQRMTYRNLGASTFAPAATSLTQGTVVDVDGDGYPDVVSPTTFGIAIALNRGDGTVVEPEVRPITAPAFSITAGDLDGDGVADLVTGGNDVLFGNGEAKLASNATGASAIALGDMNGDGTLDLVEGVSTGIVSMTGRGDGTFVKAGLAALDVPLQLVLADLDGDGIPDIAAVHATQDLSQGTSIILNGGDGVLLPRIDVATGSAFSVAAGDLDGDGRIDLVVTTGEQGATGDFAVVVLTNLGGGRFEPTWRLRLSEAMRVAIADIDRDGRLDLVLFGSNVMTLRGAPFPQRFFDPTSYVLGPDFVSAGVVTDLDGDGWADVVVSLLSSGTVAILRNDHGSLSAPRFYRTNSAPVALTVADVDGDGRLDLATTGQSTSAVTVLPARCSRQ